MIRQSPREPRRGQKLTRPRAAEQASEATRSVQFAPGFEELGRDDGSGPGRAVVDRLGGVVLDATEKPDSEFDVNVTTRRFRPQPGGVVAVPQCHGGSVTDLVRQCSEQRHGSDN